MGYVSLRPLPELAAAVSAPTAEAILRAMQLNPAERFAAISDFQSALTAGRATSAVAASPVSVPGTALPSARLVSQSSRTYPLRLPRNIIGRRNRRTGEAPEIDLSDEPEGDTVSRKHAWINWTGGQWYLQVHAEHKNAVKLNGAPVAETNVPLRHKDLVQVGAVVLRLELIAESSGSKTG